MTWSISTVALESETDVVLARQRARVIASLLGFDSHGQTRIATAVSEIARNAHQYAKGGRVAFGFEGESTPQMLSIEISDGGGGIPNLEAILNGTFKSAGGLGQGIRGAQRLMDRFEIGPNRNGGTTVVLKKSLPVQALLLGKSAIGRIAEEVAARTPCDTLGELHRQNQELMSGLQELQRKREQLEALNRELQDTNRGVVALYAEIDERAEQSKRSDNLKSLFLSNMSHEFRTPLNSILALTRLLEEGNEGTLAAEQAKQVSFIRRSAESLVELVDDLLDLAKVEAGKAVVRPSPFLVSELFGALRGMMRPLRVKETVDLVFDEVPASWKLFTDEAKVGQILRNFVSNALKFTEAGEVRVSARMISSGERIEFAVRDTGIGIEKSQQEEIFREFSQIDSPIQKKVKGTGLGLPLTRRLAALLGGSVRVESELGKGSTFFLDIPVEYRDRKFKHEAAVTTSPPESAEELGNPELRRILLIDDDEVTRYLVRRHMSGLPYRLQEASTAVDGLLKLQTGRYDAILLDLSMPDLSGYEVLEQIQRASAAKSTPVIIVTSTPAKARDNGRLARAHSILPKSNLTKDAIARVLARACGSEAGHEA